jgi:hypothetical protein
MFTQMQRGQNRIKGIKGLRLGLLFGTGAGEGFSLKPDFSTYAFFGVWENTKFASSFFYKNSYFEELKNKSSSYFTCYMKYIKGHGKWYGKNPFVESIDYKPDCKIAVITRATVRWSKALDFWRHVPKASQSISEAKGVLFNKGIGEWPLIQQATFSVWENEKAMYEFAYKQKTIHEEIVRLTKTRNWYKEDLFSRYHLLALDGNWPGLNII